MDLMTYALSKKYTDKVAGQIITNKDDATEGQILTSNGDGTSSFSAPNSDLTEQIAIIEQQLDDISLSGGAGVTSQTFIATAGQTEFALTNTNGVIFELFWDGVRQGEGVDYNLNAAKNTATLTEGAIAGEIIDINYSVAVSGTGSGHVIQDENVDLTARAKLDFVGAGVTVTDDGANGKTIVTINGGGGSSAPIATFTQSGNKEVVVTEVGVATGTFTSAGHGMANNQQCAPTLNSDAGKVFLVDKVPIGLTMGTRYVVNATLDTFQLSASSGGAALTYTTNANMDLTKWHFEKSPGAFTPFSLPAAKKYRLHVRGKSLIADNFPYLMVNAIENTKEWTGISFVYTTFPIQNIWSDVYYDIDFNGFLSIYQSGVNIKTNTASANSISVAPLGLVNTLRSNADITSLTFNYPALANGTVVEVYAG